jgi:hypothetical protein
MQTFLDSVELAKEKLIDQKDMIFPNQSSLNGKPGEVEKEKSLSDKSI